MKPAKAPIRNGLRDITMSELRDNPLLVADTLEQKLAALPINERQLPQFARQMVRRRQ